MTLRLTVQEDGGSTQVIVSLSNGSGPKPFGQPQPFTSPLAISDFEDLRFYLEDYASLPVGEYALRGERVERERLSAWGEALYVSIFGGDPKRKEAYCQAAECREAVEIAISSNDPRFLALPWELMKARGEGEPLSARVASFDRSLPVSDPPRHFASTAEAFRVLMVIARPGGLKDVPFQAVARPLFQHLERNKSAVKIEVLRPPSFEELQRCLKTAKEEGKPYHAVHFDGHGMFEDLQNGAGRQGFVVFEREDGYPKLVAANEFAVALKEGGVPLVILNACQSGKIETDAVADPAASVATRLLQDGAASVVAMSHSVYVVAAAAFIATFYEELFAGKTVSEAVNAGRKALRLKKNCLRPSLKGDIPLQDWIVPVHYARSVLRLPQGETKPAPASTAEKTAAKVLGAAKIEDGHTADDLAAVDGVFFGRDNAFFALERAIRTHGMAIIHGVGGTGKTELAKAFARWLQISNGLADPRLVFFHSFEPGLPTFGLDLIVNEIMARLGNAQAYLAAETTRERAELVLQLFRQLRCLLIWDNFETVASMPEPGQATPPLDEAKKKDLLWFIGELRKSQSALLITSRSDERWLGGPEVFVRCEVGGLGERDALQYADHLLAPHAQASARRAAEPKAFKELIDYLGGHPLSLKLILPRLAETSPALLAGLKGQGALPAGFGAAEGRLESLGASVYYSFRHLPEEDRRRLVILSLFEQVVSASILGVMQDAPPRFQGFEPLAWHMLLGRLADLGLLTSLGRGLYQQHPALPSYLGALWQSQFEAAGDYGTEREATLRSLIGAAATYADFLHSEVGAGDAQGAIAAITASRMSLGAFLSAAVELGLFDKAQDLIQALNHYWEVAGFTSEAQAWGDRVIKATEPHPGEAPKIETPAHNLWLFVISAEANRAQIAGDLAKCERIERRIVASFEGRNRRTASQRLSAAYLNLGNLAFHRRKLGEADEWYKKSLALAEAQDDELAMAFSYHQLGMVALYRGHLDEAEGFTKKCLAILEALNDQPHTARSCHQLGMVALYRGRLDEAEVWYKKSLAIKEALGDQLGMATSYGELGNVDRERGHLQDAEGWYKKALVIFEVLSERPKLGVTCHNLGMVSEARRRLDEAEGWYKKSLAIMNELGDQPSMAKTYHQLGNLAFLRGNSRESEAWYMQALAIFDALGDERGKDATLENLAILIRRQRRGNA